MSRLRHKVWVRFDEFDSLPSPSRVVLDHYESLGVLEILSQIK